jgi:exopolysaccharide biosynthesis polyprenyl glycosylphosphotransferase
VGLVAVDAAFVPLGRPVVVRRSQRSWERHYVRAVVGADIVAALLGGVAAYLGRFGDELASKHHAEYLLLSGALPVLWLIGMAAWRAYEMRFLSIGAEEFRRVFLASTAVIAVVGAFSWATKAEIARGYMIIALPLATLLTLLGRYVVRKRVNRMRSQGRCMSNVLVVGHAKACKELVREIRREIDHGMRVVGACVPGQLQSNDLVDLGAPVVGGFEGIEAAVRTTSADTVAVLACPEMDGPALRQLSWSLARTGTDLLVAPALLDVTGPRVAIRVVSNLPLLHVNEPELSGGRRLAKALIDRVIAATALIMLLPVFCAIALAVRLTSPGGAFFRQKRVGWHGDEFTMLKFRTMGVDADARRAGLEHLNSHGSGPLFKIPNDPRVTSVGRWLRRLSLDELPQLVNVVRGDMSLVGPRPPLPEEVAQYEGDVRRRLFVKPGLTGLWQISGRANLEWEDAVRLDLRYVENWSLALDALIIWKTFFALVKRDGAY